MLDRNKNKENLPALKSESFALANVGPALTLNPELAKEIDKETDFEGYTPPKNAFPIVSIRQKPGINPNTGKQFAEAGGFKIYDALAKATDSQLADVPAEAGLLLTVLFDQPSRTYWENIGDAQPACRSLDGKNGVGKPGGNCEACPKSAWQNGDRPACSNEMNVLVLDHGLGGCYLLRLGRSALKPWNLFKSLVDRQGKGGIPLHALRVRVSTAFESEPAPHFTPTFTIEGQVDLETFRKMKGFRDEYKSLMQKTVQIVTTDEEHPAAVDTPHEELPNRANKDGEVLPF